MDDTADTDQVIIRPPVAWGLAVIAPNWLAGAVPPVNLPVGWLGAVVFVLALALGVSAVITMTKAGSNVPINRPITTIVANGPYRFTRVTQFIAVLRGRRGNH